MKDIKINREQERAEKRRSWERHIQMWRASGLSQTEYQRKHNLSKWQFVYWKKKFEQPVSSEVSLVPISLPQAMPTASYTTLRFLSWKETVIERKDRKTG
jgi:hypothetical protein